MDTVRKAYTKDQPQIIFLQNGIVHKDNLELILRFPYQIIRIRPYLEIDRHTTEKLKEIANTILDDCVNKKGKFSEEI